MPRSSLSLVRIRRDDMNGISSLFATTLRMNIRAVLDDNDMRLTAAYSLALQAEHLLQVVESKRQHEAPPPSRIRWTDEMRARLLTDRRPAKVIAKELGTNIYYCSSSLCAWVANMQRSVAKKAAA